MADRFTVDLPVLEQTVTSIAHFQEQMRAALAAAESTVGGMPWQGAANAQFTAVYAAAHANLLAAVDGASDLSAMLSTAHDDYTAAAQANSNGWGGGAAVRLNVSPLLLIDVAADFLAEQRSLSSQITSAVRSMHGNSHMGGDDKNGVQWSHAYDDGARTVMSNLSDLVTMIASFAVGLDLAGQNHSYADVAGRPLTGRVTAVPFAAEVTPADFPGPPTAVGGSAPTPEFWSWLGGEVSGLWPNGDSGKIRGAGDAWGSIADALADAKTRLGASVGTLSANTAPESRGIRDRWSELSGIIDTVRTDCRSIADNCHSHAANIDDAHSQIINALVQFAAGAAITAVIAAALTPVTFGISDAVGAGAVAGEVALATADVVGIAARFLALVRSLGAELMIARVAFAEWRIGAPVLDVAADGVRAGTLTGNVITIAKSSLSVVGRGLVDLTLGPVNSSRLAGGLGAIEERAAVSDPPEWLKSLLERTDLPAWRRNLINGQKFNWENAGRYPESEVTLANGKRLDSYRPGREIVSRKFTQLGEIKESTAQSYLNEIINKYKPGTIVKSTGQPLRGDLYLEVPVQASGSVPETVLEYAAGLRPPVTIRDVTGHVYASMKGAMR